jgi:hypothetical protein
METNPSGTTDTQAAVAGPESIRKQVYDLRPSDLETFPIWEHPLDEEGEPGQDEATVKPRPDLGEADPGEGLLVVRAEFVARDGTKYDGYVYPSFDFDLSSIQPTIVTAEGQVNFWHGAFAPKRSDLERDYELLGRDADRLFPVRFRALVEHQGAKLEGEVPAFLHFKSVGGDEVVRTR